MTPGYTQDVKQGEKKDQDTGKGSTPLSTPAFACKR